MSTGPRIPLAAAYTASEVLMTAWGMNPADCVLVGSARRRRINVGDLEFIAPHEPEDNDRLYGRIEPTVCDMDGVLFGDKPVRFGTVIRGFKPGFWAASLEVKIAMSGGAVGADAQELTIPVQIFRYVKGDKGNRGWIELMRTGPQDFGILFLQKWKYSIGIRDGQGSIDGFLSDPWGKPIPTPDEESCFRLAKMEYIPAAERDGFTDRYAAQAGRQQRETMR